MKKIIFITIMVLTMTIAVTACVQQHKDDYKTEKYTVSYKASEGGFIQGEDTQEVVKGSDASVVTAVANDGYKFKKWSDGVVTAERQDTNIMSDMDVTAEFEKCFESGKGTTEDPYMISEYKHLINMVLFPNANYKLKNDMDLSGKRHEPIFCKEKMFMGKFDGNGKTIKNLTIDSDSENPSLFGYIGEGAEVGNFKLENARLIINYENIKVGTVAATSYGILKNISGDIVFLTMHLNEKLESVGGLVGITKNLIKNCHIVIKMYLWNENYLDTDRNVGGVVGFACANIEDCSAKTEFDIQEMSREFLDHDCFNIGGLIGKIDNADLETNRIISIKGNNVTVKAALSGDVSNVDFGGCISKAVSSPIQIENCKAEILSYVFNIDTGYHGGHFGGFIAVASSNDKNISIKNCSAMADNVAGAYKAGGFVESLTGVNVKECYFNGNIKAEYNCGGFCNSVLRSDVYQCYAIVDLTSVECGGFICSGSDTKIEQCFVEGEIFTQRGGGFAKGLSSMNLNNCYSTVNVYRKDIGETYGYKPVCGFACEVTMKTQICNSYCGGNVIGEKENGDSKLIYECSFALLITQNSKIENVHYCKYENSVAEIAYNVGVSQDFDIDLFGYEDLSTMYNLATTLNNGENDVWVDCKDSLPALSFCGEIK